MIDDYARQDALDWLEQVSHGDDEATLAKTILGMLEEADSLEMTVIGMLSASRPHDEIRKYMLTREFEDPE